ncbi:MAG TPA: hypothetical protein VK540_08365 [Polyangiaceae bacterium]|nr:hypothetical protein [Polyangiaceae bacterium]
MNRHPWKVGLGVAGLTLGLASPAAHAETPTDRLEAEALAGAAAALVARGEYAHACRKYEASARLDPGARRFMKLADCQERAGMTARAWMSYGDAQDWAQTRGDNVLAGSARDNAKRLDAKLGRIEIVVPPGNEIEGLQIRRDGALVADAVRGVPVPVDTGLHVISAAAPGRRAWSTTIGLSPGKTTVSVVIPFLDEDRDPALSPDPTPSSSSPARPDDRDTAPWRDRAPLAPALAPSAQPDFDPDRGGTQRTVGWVLGGTGLASLAVGTIFALQASSTRASLNDSCAQGACGAPVREQLDTMRAQATASNVFFLGGVASLAGGAIVYFTAPAQRAERSTASLQVVPSVAPGAAGLWASGRF